MLSERIIRDTQAETKTRILWDHKVKGLASASRRRAQKHMCLTIECTAAAIVWCWRERRSSP